MLKNIEFIFFHIEKCMGTSFRYTLYNYFKKIYTKEEIFAPEINVNVKYNLLFNDNYEYLNNLENDYKILLCHIAFNSVICKKLYTSNTFSVTVVRNPYTRILSHYYFFSFPKTNKKFNELNNDEIVNFLTHCGNIIAMRLIGNHNILNNVQIFESAIENIDKINCVLIMENINEDLELFNEILNKKYKNDYKLELGKNNTNDMYKNNIETDMILLEKYKDHFDIDIKIYDYILSLPINKRFKI